MRDTIDMAREAGLAVATGFDDGPDTAISIPVGSWGVEEIERLVAIVRADEREETNRRANASWTLMCEKMVAFEREACAKVCEAEGQTPYATKHAAANIRARGKK